MAEYLQKVFTDGDFDFSVSWLAGYTDPTMVIAWWNPEFAVWNQVFQENVPELSAGSRRGQDDAGRRRARRQADRDLRHDRRGANLLALVSKTDYVAYRDDKIEVKVPAKSGSSNTFQHIDEFEPLE